jgi:hypothetical protein
MERIMGGSSGGSSFTLDIEQLKTAANQRIREAFSINRKILFVSSIDDSERLRGEIARSQALQNIEWQQVDSVDQLSVETIESASLVVVYVYSSASSSVVDEVVMRATSARKSCVFVRAAEDAPVPQYVMQYRIRAVSWRDLMDLISS